METPDLEALRLKAEVGDVEAQCQLSEVLWKNLVDSDDIDEPLKWVRAAAKHGHPQAQWKAGQMLLCFERSTEEVEEGVEWIEKASSQGHLGAMQEMAFIYLYGKNYETDEGDVIEIRFRSPRSAFRLYEKLYALGDLEAHYQSGLLLLQGRGVPKDTEEGFSHLLNFACHDCVNHAALVIISDCYAKGIGTDKNPVEAYIWALMARSWEEENELDYRSFILEDIMDGDYEPVTKAHIQALEAILANRAISSKAQKEARRRDKLREEGKLTPEYCLGQAAKYKPGLAPGDRVKIIGRAVIPEEPTAKAKETPADDDDPEPSSDLVFRYLKVCNKHFDPSLVQFELIIPHKLTRKETLDFTQIKIRYNGRNTDLKNVTTFAAKHIYKAERRLLLRLAAQYSVSDAEKRNQNIYRILQEPRMRPAASRWNSLFEDIFPQCSKHRYNKMINRETGHIAIALTVDTTKITNASDYDTCYLKF